MLERTPEIETPAYAVLASHEAEGWEVRSQRVHDRARHARAMPCACHMRAMHMHMLRVGAEVRSQRVRMHGPHIARACRAICGPCTAMLTACHAGRRYEHFSINTQCLLPTAYYLLPTT